MFIYDHVTFTSMMMHAVFNCITPGRHTEGAEVYLHKVLTLELD
jgi:hypothetical protein